MLASAAARFSALTSSQISCRKIGTLAGASMPMRTVEPDTSSTSTVMSSPMQTRSPILRVITSMTWCASYLVAVAGTEECTAPARTSFSSTSENRGCRTA